MHRWCVKLRSVALKPSQTLQNSLHSSRRIFHSSPPIYHPLHFAASNLSSRPLFNPPLQTNYLLQSFRNVPSSFPVSVVQVRHVSSRERRKRRKPMTPVTSKLKKVKMKFYSSYKSRFWMRNDGSIKRRKEGKRHNAHSKSKKSKRRLRQPGTVPLAYAKVMKKLNFCG